MCYVLLKLVSKTFLQRSTLRYFGGNHAAPTAAAATVVPKEENLVSAFHVGRSLLSFFPLLFHSLTPWLSPPNRPLDLSKVRGIVGNGQKVQTGPNFVKVITNEAGKEGFDVYSYGSIVFYNTKRAVQRDTTAKILGLGVEDAIAPYQMEGYDNYDTLLEVLFTFTRLHITHLTAVS